MKKAALITGASSGIGAATAIEFSKKGYFVYLMGRNKEKLEKVALLCRNGAALLSCDLLNVEAVDKRLAEAFNNKLYKIEVLVNNAGIYISHDIESGTDEMWRQQFEVNVMAPMRLVRSFIPYFKQQGGGSIVNVASTLGLRSGGSASSYSATKAALINFSQTIAAAEGKHQIRSNCVCPGIVETPIHGGRDLSGLANLQPLGRIGQPEDIAKSIYFLGSEDSAWTTGAVLSVDGGINL